jgi:hypothetical protein
MVVQFPAVGHLPVGSPTGCLLVERARIGWNSVPPSTRVLLVHGSRCASYISR